ncbi:MAG: VOC family protein [Lachnospiraceae bacterium]|nr:VOC family protein [Lachnospiraceae bacterium]
MQVEHVGYVVKSIEKSVVEFEKLGYEKCSTFFKDEKRKINIQFMKKDNYEVELIEPHDEESDAYAYYKKLRNGPYHICYKVDNIEESIKKLVENGYILVKEKEAAIAYENKNVCFLYKDAMGLIELVEK